MGSRYEVIVAELRQQIEAGALAPGEAGPSTRESTRQGGVGVAAATKGLTATRRAGPGGPGPGGGTGLELAPRLLWTLCRPPPWLAPAMSMTRPQAMPNALPYTEFVLQSLDGHGLSLSDMVTVYLTMVNFVRGIAVNLEAEAEAE